MQKPFMKQINGTACLISRRAIVSGEDGSVGLWAALTSIPRFSKKQCESTSPSSSQKALARVYRAATLILPFIPFPAQFLQLYTQL